MSSTASGRIISIKSMRLFWLNSQDGIVDSIASELKNCIFLIYCVDDACTGVIRQCNTCPIKYLPELEAAVNKIRRKYKNNLCFEFSTGYEEKVVSTVKKDFI